MNKPVYRHLAEQKWYKYKRLVLKQRIHQMDIVPDLLPFFKPTADVDLAFGRKKVAPGDFVSSAVSEQMPRLTVQTFEPGEKLVTIVVVDADVPQPEKDCFTTRCHFIASNIPISPTQTSIPLIRIDQDDKKTENEADRKIVKRWVAPWAHKGAPYHRIAVFVFEQQNARPLWVNKVAMEKRDGFNLGACISRHNLVPIGGTLFRTKWDDTMADVMERTGKGSEVNFELKNKKIIRPAYRKRTERMR